MVVEVGEKVGLREYVPQQVVEIEYPTTCYFDVSQSLWSTANSGAFRFLNLSDDVQKLLYKDKDDPSIYRTVSFYAGYEGYMPLIFTGDCYYCNSYRESGSVDFVTEMAANNLTYLYQNGISAVTVGEGTELPNLLQELVSFKYLEIGHITNKIRPSKRRRTFIGQTFDLINREYGKGYDIYINNGQLNILAPNEVIESDVSIITADTGLLGSPRRANNNIECDMLFEPRLIAGQAVEVSSSSLPWFNNTYKVQSVRHAGTISPVESGVVKTTVGLQLGQDQYQQIKKATGSTFGGQATEGQWEKPVNGRVSSPFGYRVHPVQNRTIFHKGMDIAVAVRTPVKAPADGKVVFQGNDAKGYGYYLKLDHGKTEAGVALSSMSAHVKEFAVAPGDVVAKGQVIAWSGGDKGGKGSGNSTGPHLHFEISENGKNVNPTKYIGNF